MENENEKMKIIGFTLNSEEYAFEVSSVQSIIKFAKSTRVPRSKDYIVGVINLRGMVIPIVDLNKRFGMKSEYDKEKQRIVILELGSLQVGIIVDTVSEVIEVESSQIFSNPTITSSINKEYLKGVCKLQDERLLTLLNIEKILEIKTVS